MPHIPFNKAANQAAAEFLRKMADLVERGEAYTVDYHRVAVHTAFLRSPAEPVEVEYVMSIKVREVPDGG